MYRTSMATHKWYEKTTSHAYGICKLINRLDMLPNNIPHAQSGKIANSSDDMEMFNNIIVLSTHSC